MIYDFIVINSVMFSGMSVPVTLCKVPYTNFAKRVKIPW